MPRRRPHDTDSHKRPGGRDVNAATRVIVALDAAIEGHDWQTVANQAGYGSRGAAYHAVQRELERRIEPRVDYLRQIHYERLQAYRRVYVPKAMAGDGYSLDRCLRIDEREAQLMGLDARDMVALNPQGPVILEIPADLAAAIRGDHLLASRAPVVPSLDPAQEQSPQD